MPAGRTYTVTELGGGLTNRNYRVTTTDPGERGDYVVRVSSNESGLLAIDRANERHNTARAWEAGVGAPGRRGAPRRQRARRRLPRGADAGRGGRARRRDASRGSPRPYAPCTPGRRSWATFDMRAIRRRYLDIVTVERVPAAGGLPRPRPAGRGASRTRWPRATRRSVPCNNDLLAANFIDDGDRIWIIDYEYRGMNEASFELGNICQRVRPRRGDTRLLVDRLLGRPATRASWPVPGRGRCSRGTAGRCGRRSRTASRRSTSTSGPGAWRSTTRRGRRCSARAPARSWPGSLC